MLRLAMVILQRMGRERRVWAGEGGQICSKSHVVDQIEKEIKGMYSLVERS